MKPILTGVMAAILAAGAQNNEAERQLKAAMNAELVNGDLKAAIQQYGEIVAKYAKSDRAVTAMALVHVAECYQKMGNAESRKIYERVVREFADQVESATLARTRLAALQSPAGPRAGQTARQIWTGPGVDNSGSPSPDGRYLTFTDWETGDLAVRDLTTGTNRRLTNTGRKGEYAQNSVISPDGRQVAYSWLSQNAYELRILPLDAREAAQPRIVHRSSDQTLYVTPHAWTPDGKQLLVTCTLRDRTIQIAIASVQDGSIRVLKSVGWQYPGASLSPDGRYIAYAIPAGDNVQTRDIFVLAADGSRETVVVQGPANDDSPLWSPDGTQILFLSDRTGKTSLWTVPIDGGKPNGPAKLVKTEIGSIYGMTRSGALYYFLDGNRRNIYVGELDAEMKVTKAPGLATERFVNSNDRPAWSPDGQYLAYYSFRGPHPNSPGSTMLVIRTLKTGEERDIPLRLLIPTGYNAGPPRWFPDGRSVLVASRDPQRQGLGYYRVELATGSAELLHSTRREGNPTNRPDISPDGKTIFYADSSVVDEHGGRLMRFDIDSRRETELRPPKGGFLSSFAVSPDGTRLAYSLSGGYGGSSSLEVMPAAGGEPREVFRAPRSGGALFNTLAWTPDQRYLLFAIAEGEDKKAPLWRVAVTGGAPEKMISMGIIKSPQVHPDGRRIAFGSIEPGSYEVWALENFLPTLKASK